MKTASVHPGISRQIADRLRDSIRGGTWSAGERLPSIRQMTETYGVSFETVRGSLRELEAQSLIECRPRQGAFVTSDGEGGKRPWDDHVPRPTQIGVVRLIGPTGPCDTYSGLPGGMIEESWGHRIVHSLEHAVLEEGYSISFISERRDAPDLIERIVAKIENLGPALAGLVLIVHSEQTRAILDAIESRSLPCLTVTCEGVQRPANSIAAANRRAGERVGRCFARLGYQRLMFVGTALTPFDTNIDKVSGVIRGYGALNLPAPAVTHLTCEDVIEEVGYQAVRRHLQHSPPPQGVFGTGDLLMFGAVRALRERGLAVPGDVGVVGSTGTDAAARFDPPLTVVRQPVERMGVEIAELLLPLIRGETTQTPSRLIPTSLIVRDSLPITEAVRAELESCGGVDDPCRVTWESSARVGRDRAGSTLGAHRGWTAHERQLTAAVAGRAESAMEASTP